MRFAENNLRPAVLGTDGGSACARSLDRKLEGDRERVRCAGNKESKVYITRGVLKKGNTEFGGLCVGRAGRRLI